MDNQTPNNNFNRRPEDNQGQTDNNHQQSPMSDNQPQSNDMPKDDMSSTPSEKKGSGVTMIVLLVVLVLVIVGIFLFNRSDDTAITDDVTPQEYAEIEETNDQPPVSESDDLSAIEADLEATNFAGAEADAEALEE